MQGWMRTAMDFLANTANGDARVALGTLELAVLTTEPQTDKTIHITWRRHRSVSRSAR